MHSFGIAIVPVDTADIYDLISRIIAPYYCEMEVEPYKVVYSTEDAMDLARHHTAKNLQELVSILHRKGADDVGIENGNFYRVSTYNPNSKWDYWIFGGNFTDRLQGRSAAGNPSIRDRDENVLANVCEVVNLPDGIVPALIVEPDGKWHDSDDFSSLEAWEIRVRELFGKYPHHIAVVLDVHF